MSRCGRPGRDTESKRPIREIHALTGRSGGWSLTTDRLAAPPSQRIELRFSGTYYFVYQLDAFMSRPSILTRTFYDALGWSEERSRTRASFRIAHPVWLPSVIPSAQRCPMRACAPGNLPRPGPAPRRPRAEQHPTADGERWTVRRWRPSSTVRRSPLFCYFVRRRSNV